MRGVGGCIHLCREVYNLLLLSKENTEQSHFAMLFKAMLIHILSINTSAFPLSLRIQDVSCHTEQCKRTFNGISF